MQRFIIVFGFVGLICGAGLSQAGPMVLTSQGDIYKVWVGGEGLVLSHSSLGNDTEDTLIPETAGLDLDGVELVVEERTSTPFILWTRISNGLSSVLLSALVEGTWFGPSVIGGGDGVIVSNPRALLHTYQTVLEEEGNLVPESLETTFLHTVWWHNDTESPAGFAVYFPIPLAPDGMPLIDQATAYDLNNLLPFGVACNYQSDIVSMASPRFFIGPDGLPQLFTPDFDDCLFALLDIDYETEELDVPDAYGKRRRSIAVFRTTNVTMAVPPDIDLESSKMLLRKDNSVLIFWDGNNGIKWIISGAEGWTDIHTLAIDNEMSHEQAVDLLIALAR